MYLKMILLFLVSFVLLNFIKESLQIQMGCTYSRDSSNSNCFNDSESGDRRCFYLCKNGTPLNLVQAMKECEKFPMTLAVDDTEGSHKFISKLFSNMPKLPSEPIQQPSKAWLNGIYGSCKGTFQWCWHSTGGYFPINDRHWRNKKPSCRNSSCAIIISKDGYWDYIDRDSRNVQMYICEKTAPKNDKSYTSLAPTEKTSAKNVTTERSTYRSTVSSENTEVNNVTVPIPTGATKTDTEVIGNFSASSGKNSDYFPPSSITLVLSVVAVAISINCAVLFLILYCRKGKSKQVREEIEMNDVSGESVEVPYLDKCKNSQDVTEEKIARLREISRYSVREVEEARSTLNTDKAKVRFCSVLEQPDVVRCVYKDEGHTYQDIPDNPPIYHELDEVCRGEGVNTEQLVDNVAYRSADGLENMDYKKVSIVDNEKCNKETGDYSKAYHNVMVENDLYTQSNIESDNVTTNDLDLVENEIYQTSSEFEQNGEKNEIPTEDTQEPPSDEQENLQVMKVTEGLKIEKV